MKTQKFFNRTEAVNEIKTRSGFVVSYISLWSWEKKGYIRPTGTMGDGTRIVPVFTSEDIDAIIKKIREGKKDGTIKVRRIPKSKL